MRGTLSLLALCLTALSLRAEEPEAPRKSKYDMTYDELANLRIASASSLTSIERRKINLNLGDRDLNRTHTYVMQDYSTMPFSFALTYEFKF